MQYPALPRAAGEAAVRRLLDTVDPGGLLLAVYHDLDDEHREHVKSWGVDPADYVELDAVEPRIDPPRLVDDEYVQQTRAKWDTRMAKIRDVGTLPHLRPRTDAGGWSRTRRSPRIPRRGCWFSTSELRPLAPEGGGAVRMPQWR
jgi:hypothetical protein